jgi:multiple sugar transport system substrate-binding protein
LSIAIGAAVSKRSRFKEEALLLVSYMASPEAQQYIARHTLSIPSWQRSLRDPLQTYGMNVPSRYALYREMMFSMRSHSELGLPVKAYTPVFRLLKEYWAGLMEEDELVGKLRGLLSAGE